MATSPLNNLCNAFRRRLRSLLLQGGLCRIVLVGLVALPPLMALDWWLHLPTLWRCTALSVYLAAIGATGWWTLLAPMRQRWSNQEILSHLDAVLPGKDGTLLEFYELNRGEGIEESGSPVGHALVNEAARQLAPLVEQAIKTDAFSRRSLARWRGAAGAALVLFVAASLPLSEYLSIGAARLFNPFSPRRWPHRTSIDLEIPPGGFAVPQLEALEIKAGVSGAVPQEAILAYRAGNSGYWIKERLAVGPDKHIRYVFPEVREPISFYLEGGDDTTDTQRIAVIERPYLKRITASYEYPQYAGLPNRSIEGGQLFGVEGTKVRLNFESSMALKKGVIHFQGRGPEELPLTSATTFENSLVLAADTSYSVELYEKNGFRESRPERYEVRVTPYNPPEVELLAPGQNLVCTKQARVKVAFRASDAFKLKKVEFLYQAGDATAALLSDRVTGPLDPQGKNLEARFTWDLAKMDLPAMGIVQYFVRASDVNPTGRGVTDSAKLQIKLVALSEFHFETFEQAKKIEAEARLAWENQFAAWKAAATFAHEGSGKEDDPAWQSLKDKQQAAIRSAGAMEAAMGELIERYDQNDMAREFMAGRLDAITKLLRQVTTRHHPAIARALDQARPRSDADANPQRLKVLRAAALSACSDDQKLAVLDLERLLKRLFDWRDLQTTLIRATLLHEEQAEVLALTEQIAPKTLGLEMEDLSNDVQDKLLTLGKRQRTLFDVEGELEKELEFQVYRAETQKRRTVVDPLRAAYKGLRDTRVNDNLRVAAGKIESNQSFQIIANQKSALAVLSIVKGGLIQAGQKVDPEEPITTALAPSDIIEVQPRPKTEEVTTTSPTTAETPEVSAVSPQDLLGNLPPNADPLSAAISTAWEAQDEALARTDILADNSSAAEMPRYVKLKRGILLRKQAVALRAIEKAIEEAGKANAPAPHQMLESVQDEMGEAKALIEANQTTAVNQQIQADTLESLDDLRRLFIPLQESVREAAAENKRQGGADAFNQKYLLRDQELDQAVAILEKLNELQLWERDVVRKLDRFTRFPAKEGLPASTEKAGRARASAEQRRAVTLLAPMTRQLTGSIAAKIGNSGIVAVVELKLGDAPAGIDGGGQDPALRSSLNAAADSAAVAFRGLKDLLGEREKAPVVASKPATQSQALTLEEWEKLQSPAALRERLQADKRLPPEVREIMLKSLGKDFPPKYRDLLAAYYASFVVEEKKQ